MGKVIDIEIREKIARNLREHEAEYVCGNSDFVVAFDFDAEWNAFNTKTARFKYNGTHQDVVFTGNQVHVPIIDNTHKIQVGVFAGDLHTTTPAIIMAKKSILCGGGSPAAPADDVYNQIMDLLNKGGASAEQIQNAVQDYLEKNPPQGVSDEHIRSVTEDLLAEAKASGEFDGEPGQPGKDGKDYILTEADKKEIADMVEGGGSGGNTVTDDHINSLIDAKLGVIENGTY